MLHIALLIFLLSIVQSLFGVGLLVFGTPLLLFLGHPFPVVLLLLLPASATISALQFLDDAPAADLRKTIALCCFPAVIAGIVLLLSLGHAVNIKFWVGLLMICTAALRFFGPGQSLNSWLQSRSTSAFAVIGFVHGFTNMGGGLLAALIASVRLKKANIRANIAFAYLGMALAQLLVLKIFAPPNQPSGTFILLLMGIAGGTYLAIGRPLFHHTPQRLYEKLLTGFIAAFGLALVSF